jgi:hypothetical protein
MELLKQTKLAVLLGAQSLFENGQLDVLVGLRKIEVGREVLGWLAVFVEGDRETVWLMEPFDPIAVE